MVSCGFANICGGVLNSPQCEQPVFLQAGVPAPPYLCRFRPVGKGLERETLCPVPRLRRFGTHYETGSKFLLLFSIKSKEEILCFAERVLNGRMTNVVQPPLSLYLDYSTKPAPHFLRLSYNSPSPFGCKIPLGLL